jgi:hypothetical protein
MRSWIRTLVLFGVAFTALIAHPFGARAENIQVELVTVGPDRAVDTRFGHILLRITDAESGRDDAYDFGVADFHQPGFIVKAALGRAQFRLRRSSAQIRFESYRARDRQIVAQRLNLTEDQTAYLIERLDWNLKPENVAYDYDHVIDNCSTRLRDLLNDVTDGAIQLTAYAMPLQRTYREENLVAGSGWMPSLISFDLATGRHGEDRVGAWQLSFLPHRLHDVVAIAENPAMGEGAPLVAFETVLHRRTSAPTFGGSVRVGRSVVIAAGAALGVFFAIVGFTAWIMRRCMGWLSRLAGLVLIATSALFGGIGTAVLPIALFSDGVIWTQNQNAWFFFPLDFVLMGPGFRWLWTGRATLAAWTRVYIDLRFLMVVVGWTGIAYPQDNGAFALATALTLIGLRTQPIRE